MNDALLMVFVKNPELGKVKTRLAAEAGPEKALEIYKRLLNHTRDITAEVKAKIAVYFSPSVPAFNPWHAIPHEQALQPSGDLGQRMATAFQMQTRHYERVIIIGSDNPELRAHHINSAFDYLKEQDVVLGPAKDGGYYLLGMQVFQPALFANISWSTSRVWDQTLSRIRELSLTYATLPTQNDIDTYADWLACSWEH